MRCFISIDVEDEKLLDEIERIQGMLLASKARIKPVERKNIHLTIRFLGEIPQSTVREVIEAMKRIEFRRFEVMLEGIGSFPERSSRPRVIWIGVSEGSEETVLIHKALEEELRRIGFPKDRERFVPHITIARVKWSTPKLVKIIYELRDVKIGKMSVTSIRLKKSTLTSKGPIYETLFEVKGIDV